MTTRNLGIVPESPFKTNLLQGLVALVVGGGTNICFDIALTLGRHGASIGRLAVGLLYALLHVLNALKNYTFVIGGFGNPELTNLFIPPRFAFNFKQSWVVENKYLKQLAIN